MKPKNPKKTTRVSKVVAELTGKEIRYQKEEEEKNTIKETYWNEGGVGSTIYLLGARKRWRTPLA